MFSVIQVRSRSSTGHLGVNKATLNLLGMVDYRRLFRLIVYLRAILQPQCLRNSVRPARRTISAPSSARGAQRMSGCGYSGLDRAVDAESGWDYLRPPPTRAFETVDQAADSAAGMLGGW